MTDADPREKDASDGPAKAEESSETAASETASEPIDAEFELAEGARAALGKGLGALAGRAVTLPMAGGLALAAALVGGLIGVVFDGSGRPAADPTTVARLDAFDQRLVSLREAIAESAGGNGGEGGLAAAALADVEQELAALRAELARTNRRVTAVEASGGGGEASAEVIERLDVIAADAAEARRLSEETAAIPAAQNAAIEAIGARVDALTESVAAQGDALDSVSETTALLASRLTGVSTAPGSAGRGAAAAIAFATLQDAADAGRPFATEFEEAARYFARDEDFTALKPIAETGAPTPGAIAAMFPSVTRAVRQAEAGAPASMAERVGRMVTGLVTVRRVDAPETDAAGDIIARAKARLSKDDIAGAVAEMDRLEGPAHEAASSWITQASRRLELEDRLDALRERLAAG